MTLVVRLVICIIFLSASQSLTQVFAADRCAALRNRLVNAADAASLSGDDATAIKLYNQALAIGTGADYSDSGAYCRLSICYLGVKQYAASLKASDKAIALASKKQSTAKEKELLSYLYYKRSEVERTLGHVDNELEDLTESVQLNPSGLGAYQSRAEIYVKLGRNNDAVNDLTRALSLKTAAFKASHKAGEIYKWRCELIQVLYQRAKVYKRLGRMAEYEQDMAEANKLTEGL